jgi:hypothetical protein
MNWFQVLLSNSTYAAAARDDAEGGDGGGMDDVSLRDELMTLMAGGRDVCHIIHRHGILRVRIATSFTTFNTLVYTFK